MTTKKRRNRRNRRRPDLAGNQYAKGNRGGRGGPVGNLNGYGSVGGVGGPVGNKNSVRNGFWSLVNHKGNLPEGLPEELREAMELVFPIAAERRDGYEQLLRERLGGNPILPGHAEALRRIERCERIVLYADVVLASVGYVRLKDGDWDLHGVAKSAKGFDKDKGDLMDKLGLYEVEAKGMAGFLDQPHIELPSGRENAQDAEERDQDVRVDAAGTEGEERTHGDVGDESLDME